MYEYSELMLPKTKAIYFAFGPIEEGEIRVFDLGIEVVFWGSKKSTLTDGLKAKARA